jgi:thiosulfate/3-mercaptopyruvate sulfurtransferase
LDDDLAEHPVDPTFGGRHPLPPLADFARTLSKWGVTPESHVVVYDDKSGAMGASRLWWMLRAIGHKQVQVLNGGLQAAISDGIQLSTDDHRAKPVATYPGPRAYSGTVDIKEAGEAAKSDDKILIDVRETPRYLGQTEPLDLIAGHIPGAENLPYFNNLDADGKYRPADELADLYKQTIGDVKPENVVVHCGSGVTACHTLLGMAYAGITEPQLYVGSWSEWSRRDLPIATEEK